MILISLGVLFFDWRWGLGLFVFGWVLQLIGHAFEGNKPAFLKNPVFLIVGPFWWLKKMFFPKMPPN